MIIMEIYEKNKYIAPYDWLINKRIQEWDLRKANISILRSLNILSEEDYIRYLNMPKMQREIEMGNLRKDPIIENEYKRGLVNTKRLFFELNDIKEENILYIDHDSITVVYDLYDTKQIQGNISPYLEFRLKNTYTSFYKLFNMDFLYFNISSHESFRFKGVDEYKLREIHKKYFIDLLLSIAYSAQHDKIENTIDMIQNVYYSYSNKEMDLNYYREFTTEGKFKLFTTSYYIYYSNIVEEKDRPFIDISYNSSILRLFYKIMMTEYFKRN